MRSPKSALNTRHSWWAAAALAALATTASASPQPGDAIPPLTLQNLYYEPVTLNASPEINAHVLFFFSNTCPVARRYMARMAALDAQYREQGVQVIGVNASPADTVLDVAQHAFEYALTFPVLNDADFSAVHALGVTRTPEIAVLDHAFTLRYRGRIDDQYRLGGVRPEPSTHDLVNALDELLAGQPVTKPLTRSEGCAVTFPMLPDTAAPPTYHGDVRPILEAHCMQCHAAGGPAPVALDSFAAVVAHGDEMLRAIQDRRMPPWFAAGEESPLNTAALSPRERHRIANWMRTGQQEGIPDTESPLPPGEQWTRLHVLETGPAAEEPGRFALQAPPPEGCWLSAIGVEASYANDFAYAEAFLEISGEPESRRRLTGPLLPGLPLRWPAGEAMRLPAGASLQLRVHHRDGHPPIESERPALLIQRASGTVQREIYCAMLEHKPENPGTTETPIEFSLGAGEQLRATAAIAPRGFALTLAVASGTTELESLLSVPACDPRWPLTYAVNPQAPWRAEGAAFRWTVSQPTYLIGPTGASSARVPYFEAPSGEVRLFLYAARSPGPP